MSKLFTAIAVMQLVEQGEIDLDEDVSVYLDIPVPDWALQSVRSSGTWTARRKSGGLLSSTLPPVPRW